MNSIIYKNPIYITDENTNVQLQQDIPNTKRHTPNEPTDPQNTSNT